jgi:predicted amidohydrolase YtcJ
MHRLIWSLIPLVSWAQNADTILINGKVLTVDPKDSIAEAVAFSAGKIIAVGSTEAVQKLAAKNARVIDLHGRTATPGLIDTHCHFQEAAVLYDVEVSDPSIQQIADVLKRVEEKVASTKPGQWIRGSGWDEGKLRWRPTTRSGWSTPPVTMARRTAPL